MLEQVGAKLCEKLVFQKRDWNTPALSIIKLVLVYIGAMFKEQENCH